MRNKWFLLLSCINLVSAPGFPASRVASSSLLTTQETQPHARRFVGAKNRMRALHLFATVLDPVTEVTWSSCYKWGHKPQKTSSSSYSPVNVVVRKPCCLPLPGPEFPALTLVRMISISHNQSSMFMSLLWYKHANTETKGKGEQNRTKQSPFRTA